MSNKIAKAVALATVDNLLESHAPGMVRMISRHMEPMLNKREGERLARAHAEEVEKRARDGESYRAFLNDTFPVNGN